MTTEWFDKKPGQDPVQVAEDGSAMTVLGGGAPDWVRLPPELGGVRTRVTGSGRAPCPKCGAGGSLHMETDADSICVAECVGVCGFVWYRMRVPVGGEVQ